MNDVQARLSARPADTSPRHDAKPDEHALDHHDSAAALNNLGYILTLLGEGPRPAPLASPRDKPQSVAEKATI